MARDPERLTAAVARWIEAEFLARCGRAAGAPDAPWVMLLIEAEEELREAMTGEGDLLRAAAALGVEGAARVVKVRRDAPKRRVRQEVPEAEKPARARTSLWS